MEDRPPPVLSTPCLAGGGRVLLLHPPPPQRAGACADPSGREEPPDTRLGLGALGGTLQPGGSDAMWLAALPPPEMAPPQHWAGCRVLSPWGSWDPKPPPRFPSFLQKVTGAVQRGGAVPYK